MTNRVAAAIVGRRLPRVVASLLLLPAPATGAATRAEPQPVFVESVDVSVVNVVAFVTDAEGRRVTGLDRDDFEILQDGRPVEITNFYAVAREDRILRSLEAAPDPSRRPATTPPAPLPDDQQLNLVVYVDHYNIRPANRKRVLDALERFLEDRIWQGDNVMLMGYYKTVEVVVPFSRDPRRLAEGVRSMSMAATYRPTDDALKRQRLRLMNSAAADGDAQASFEFLRSYVQAARADLRQSAGAIERVVRSLAGLPGRKALLYVSDGLPQRPGEDLYLQMQELFDEAERQSPGRPGSVIDPLIETLREDESQLFDSIVRQANAHQVTLYTVDARGGSGESTLSAARAEVVAGSAGHSAVDSLTTLNLQEPLIHLATSTGGSSILNSFDFERALQDMADDFDSFYSLGYRPPEGGDGRRHTIEVRVRQPGLTVRHRTGFVAKPPEQRVADRTLSSLILGLEKNPHGLSVDFGAAQKEGRRRYRLPLLVRIPFHAVTLLPAGEMRQGRLRIFVAASDGEQGISDVQEIPYPVSLSAAQAEAGKGREVGYATELMIRPGLSTVAVGLWDELSGVESFVRKQVRVGKP
jgi:VWFA-related protein